MNIKQYKYMLLSMPLKTKLTTEHLQDKEPLHSPRNSPRKASLMGLVHSWAWSSPVFTGGWHCPLLGKHWIYIQELPTSPKNTTEKEQKE